MIERHWKGIAKFEEADNYVRHLLEETFPKLENIEGFVQGKILKRSCTNGIAFLIITVWKSYESIKQFAGSQISIAVVPDVVNKMMLEVDRNVLHYEVVADLNREFL